MKARPLIRITVPQWLARILWAAGARRPADTANAKDEVPEEIRPAGDVVVAPEDLAALRQAWTTAIATKRQ